MLSNNKLKYIRSLHQRKFRQKYHNFIAEGEKIVSEVIEVAPTQVETLCATPEYLEENKRTIEGLDTEVIEVSPRELRKISQLNTPNQVLVILRQTEEPLDFDFLRDNFSLYLDDIRDPGNMGTILRIADWFGVRNVIRSPLSVELYNPKVIQASMGAFLRINSPAMDFKELKSRLEDLPIYGATLDGTSVFNLELNHRSLLVIGNESKGLSEEILNQLTESVSIPKHEKGGAESLNAAIATGILCAAFRNS